MSSPLLAGPPADCCASGFKHTGTPTGKTVTIGGIDTYVSEPLQPSEGSSKRIILYYSDICGVFTLNNKLLQDFFASQGFTVLGIDYLFGDGVQLHMDTPGFDIPKWAASKEKPAQEAAAKWIEAVKQIYGDSPDTKYSAVGYCFGGPFVLELAATDFLVASAIAHPSLLTEEHFEKVKVPLLLSLAETDLLFPLESRRKAEDILVKNKASYHIQVFSGVAHGFANRADLSNENSRWAKETSARGVIGWFARFSGV